MARIYALVGLVALVGAGAWWHQREASSRVQSAVLEERMRATDAAREKLADAEARAIGAETNAAIAALEGKIERDQANARARADVSVLHGELGRMRAVLDGYHRSGGQAGEGASPGSGIDDTGALASALGQCSERYAGVAEVADRLSIQVTGLQQYITQVVAPICIGPSQP